MRQSPYSQNQRQRNNGNYSAFRTSGSLISSTAGTVCCLCLMIGAIAGWLYSDSYFEGWVKTTAIIVDVNKQVDTTDPYEHKFRYCPKIQFLTVGENNVRNITTVLDSCDDNAEDVDDIGESVDIRYDPSDPTEVVDAILPAIIEAAMLGIIVITLLCSGCCVAIGIRSFKATKASNSNNNNGQLETTYSYNTNNHSTPASIPITNLGGNGTEYNNPYGNNDNNVYATSEPVETTASAVFVAPNETPVQSTPSMISVYPEATTENTGIAAGEEAPPIVGCSLVGDNNTASTSVTSQFNSRSGSNTYVSPNTLPLNAMAPTSSYVSPSDIREAMATVDRPDR